MDSYRLLQERMKSLQITENAINNSENVRDVLLERSICENNNIVSGGFAYANDLRCVPLERHRHWGQNVVNDGSAHYGDGNLYPRNTETLEDRCRSGIQKLMAMQPSASVYDRPEQEMHQNQQFQCGTQNFMAMMPAAPVYDRHEQEMQQMEQFRSSTQKFMSMMPAAPVYGRHEQEMQQIEQFRSSTQKLMAMMPAAPVYDRHELEMQQIEQFRSSTQKLMEMKPAALVYDRPEQEKQQIEQFRSSTQKLMEMKPAALVYDRPEQEMQQIEQFKRELPIYKKKDEFLQLLHQNQVVIVVGETGCGKSTQIPQYVLESGLLNNGKIMAISQIRRMAAIMLARRISYELPPQFASNVAYNVRFDNTITRTTRIALFTDGILFQELISDPFLRDYSVIMMDESHERTLNTDVLLAILKNLLTKRRDLKLLVTSATLETEKFYSYLRRNQTRVAVFRIEGRSFPIRVLYDNNDYNGEMDDVSNYLVKRAVDTIRSINNSFAAGHILLFLTGEAEIQKVCKQLNNNEAGSMMKLQAIPCYSALPLSEQNKVTTCAVSEPGIRKVVVATNIAEASITVPGIMYVVDCGYVKQTEFRTNINSDVVATQRISKAQAIQRAGRAGRVCPGICFRMYSEDLYNSLNDFMVPEISRCSLTEVILKIFRLGLGLSDLEFLTDPPRYLIFAAFQELIACQALDERCNLTRIGQFMALFPMQPHLTKIIFTGIQNGCQLEAVRIAAFSSVNNLFVRHVDGRSFSKKAHPKFQTKEGDLFSWLTIYNEYKTTPYPEQWCTEHFIQFSAMQQVDAIILQLINILKRMGVVELQESSDASTINKCICLAFSRNVGRLVCGMKKKQGLYEVKTGSRRAVIHHDSVIRSPFPDYVVFERLIFTDDLYMVGVTPVSKELLLEFGLL